MFLARRHVKVQSICMFCSILKSIFNGFFLYVKIYLIVNVKIYYIRYPSAHTAGIFDPKRKSKLMHGKEWGAYIHDFAPVNFIKSLNYISSPVDSSYQMAYDVREII